jgi:hypothetical protein
MWKQKIGSFSEPDGMQIAKRTQQTHTLPLSTSLRWHNPDQVQRVKELKRVLFSVQAIGLP